jgi:hypothetical protein
MRARAGVNCHLGQSSRNAEAVKNGKSALKHIFFLILLFTFLIPACQRTCSAGRKEKSKSQRGLSSKKIRLLQAILYKI